ncbi:MAG: hypothetical protein WBG90_12610 [Saonia sp.]|tara:strand:+ start:640 stop:1035 length:396 start_codon:yes stop_codon:yes gene_type:complete
MDLIFGTLLGALTILATKFMGFDRDRSFYPLLLIVIALYYVLFAFQSNAKDEILFEVFIAIVFCALAVWGHHKGLKIVAFGLVLHGIYDLFQGDILFSTTPPQWWPLFCLGFDLTLGIWLFGASSKVLKTK